MNAQWSPDGSRLVFASDRNGPRDVFIKPADGASPEKPLFRSAVLFKDPVSWSGDGRFIVLEEQDPQTNHDLWVLPLEGEPTPRPYLRTPFNEGGGQISPDGRWMAYASDESGRNEIYVQSFPTPGTKYRVTSDGVTAHWWRADGKQLLIVSGDGRKVLEADVQTSAEFHAGAPSLLMTLPSSVVDMSPTRDFQRFLVSLPVDENATPSLTIVLDWTAALRKN